jgi:hypothetical protein
LFSKEFGREISITFSFNQMIVLINFSCRTFMIKGRQRRKSLIAINEVKLKVEFAPNVGGILPRQNLKADVSINFKEIADYCSGEDSLCREEGSSLDFFRVVP